MEINEKWMEINEIHEKALETNEKVMKYKINEKWMKTWNPWKIMQRKGLTREGKAEQMEELVFRLGITMVGVEIDTKNVKRVLINAPNIC